MQIFKQVRDVRDVRKEVVFDDAVKPPVKATRPPLEWGRGMFWWSGHSFESVSYMFDDC